MISPTRGDGNLTLRIIHTADWHLGDRLGGVERLGDQAARLRELISHGETHGADALLVCGDVLEEVRPDRLSALIATLAEILAPSIARGMQCVFLAGNHDTAHTFALLDGMRELVGAGHPGRVHFVDRPALIPLTAGGQTVAALVCLPYPAAGVYAVPEVVRSTAEKGAALGDAVARSIAELCERAAREFPDLPRVMAGHFLLREAPAHTGTREVAESEDVRVDPGQLDAFAYVALGHIHQPLMLGDRVRYSGALERVDFGEEGESRHAVLAEVGGDGALRLEELPLDATPLRRVRVGSIDELFEAAELLDDRDRTIVKLSLRLGPDDSASVWLAQGDALFPRLVKPVELLRLDSPEPPMLTGDIEPAEPAETVRAFLTEQLADDPDAEALLGLAAELLAEEASSL